jgi:hypothetical protein
MEYEFNKIIYENLEGLKESNKPFYTFKIVEDENGKLKKIIESSKIIGL